MTDRTATWGQRTQLERISTADWALIGERLTPNAPTFYRLVERGTGRRIHTLTVAMVQSLEDAGWIERASGGNVQRWAYRITPTTGIRVRDGGWQ